MTTITTDRARLEELLGEYWEIAFEESSGVVAIGNKANRVLHEIRALFYALAAPATAPDELERLRKDAERYRFIRDADRSDCIWREICIYAMETLDEYVDAAMDGEATMKGTP